MFNITRETRALDRHVKHAPGDGVSSRRSLGQGAGRNVAARDPPLAARSAIQRKRRILVAEDNLLIADWICDSLLAAHYSIVGPAGSVDAACALAQTADIDGAVLDLKLGHDLCFPIARMLKARGIPFVVLTGNPGKPDVPDFEPAAWIGKPMEAAALTEAVDRMLAKCAARMAAGTAGPHQTAIAHRRQAGCAANVGIALAAEAVTAGISRDKASRVRVLLSAGDPGTRAKLAAVLGRWGFDVQSFDQHPDRPSTRRRQKLRPAENIARGKLLLDPAQRRAWWDGVEVSLTAGEFDIVVLLASRAGGCCDNRSVYDCLHSAGFLSGHGEKGFWVNVRSAIRRIRRKFREVDATFEELETARAFGYRWRKAA